MQLQFRVFRRLESLAALVLFFGLGLFAKGACVPPPSGLISLWEADGNAQDYFGINNGILENGASYTNGELGEAFYFDGSSQYVDVGPASNLWLQNFTISAWVQRANTSKVSQDPTGDASIFGYGGGGYSLSLDGSGAPFLTQIGTGGVFSSAPITDTSWHDVALTVSNGAVAFYTDGALVRSAFFESQYTFNTDAAIGARSDNSGNSFLGAIDEVAVFNRPLTPAEVQSVYNAGAPGFCTNLSIIVQPTNEVGVVGGTNVFSVTAFGAPPLQYQWLFDSRDIGGATSSTLILPNVQLTNAGTYSVIVSDSSGRLVSSNATLTVVIPVSILVQPTNVTAVLDEPASFSVTAQGSSPLGYQWTLNGDDIPGATNSTCAISSVDFSNIGTYQVTITNPASSVTSDSAILAFNPQITVNGLLGTNLSFTNVASVTVGIVSTFSNATIFYTLDGSMPSPSSTSYAGPFHLSASATIRAVAYDQSFNSALSFPVTVNLVRACEPPPSGLVGWWPAEANALDTVGTNNGSLLNGAGFTAGEAGQAFSFRQAQQAVGLGSAASLRLQNFSIEAWVKRYSATVVTVDTYLDANYAEIFAFGGTGFSFGFESGAGLLDLSPANLPPNQFASSAAVTDTNWHHVAVTKSGANITFYIDGASAGSAFYSQSYIFRTNAAIGAMGDTFHYSFYGAIDELSIYNRALSPAEIQAVYFAGPKGKCAPLAILRQPTNEIAVVGQTNTFSVAASGSASLTYQWLFDSKAIINATNAVLTIADVQATNAGSYSVIVANDDGQVSSSNVTLRVITPVSIVSNPSNVVAVLGQPAAFTVSAAGSPILYYQWTLNGVGIPNATNSIYDISSVGFTNFGAYSVVVSNSGSVATSTPALLEFNPQIIVNGQYGANFSFTNVGMVQIQISSTFSSAAIFYTLDGSTPGVGSILYTGPFSVANSVTIRAVAYDQSFDSAFSSPVTITITDSCVPAPSGLVSWWPAEGSAVDAFASNNGVLLNGVTFTNGEVGEAFSFQGQTPAVDIGPATNLWLQSFTIETWIRRYSTSVVSLSAPGSAILFGFGSGSYGFGFYTGSGNLMLTQLGINGVFSTNTVTDTNFHHIAVTKSGPAVSFYVDGKVAGTNSYGNTFSFAGDAAIGARGDNYANSFLGAIDELSIYNRALSPSEIQSIYGAGREGKCSVLAVVVQPTNQTASIGSTNTFSVGAVGPAPLSYQWLMDGLPVAGATNASIVLSDVQASNDGTYSVIVSNDITSILSSNAALTVQASLSVADNGGGVVALSPSNVLYSVEQTVHATAIPTNGWSFLSWTGTISTTNPVIDIPMTNNQVLTAVFGSPITLSPGQNGALQLHPPMNPAPYGSTVQFSALPSPGYYFGLWGGSANGNVNPYVLTLTNPAPVVSALFAPLAPGNFSLVVVPNGSGQISVSPDGNTFASNTPVSVSALPSGTNQFYYWTGDASGSSDPLNFALNSNMVITANFTGGVYPLEFLLPEVTPTNFEFGLSGAPLGVYEIDVSTNLATWSALVTVTNTNGFIPLSDVDTNAPQKFYRAVPH